MSLHWRRDSHKEKPIFWVEFRPDLNPDGSKTNQAERVELGIAHLEPEQHDAHVKENERMKNPPSSRAGPCRGRGATPDALVRMPIGGNPFQAVTVAAAFQTGEVKMSAFDDLVANNVKKGEQP
jgi:hypothetical protein